MNVRDGERAPSCTQLERLRKKNKVTKRIFKEETQLPKNKVTKQVFKEGTQLPARMRESTFSCLMAI